MSTQLRHLDEYDIPFGIKLEFPNHFGGIRMCETKDTFDVNEYI